MPPYLSIWLQTVLGMSPLRGGLVLLPLAPELPLSWRRSAVGCCTGCRPGSLIGGGLLLVGIGGFCMAVLDAGSGWPALIPGLALVGVGTGLVSPGLGGAALAAVPPARAGMAGGAVNTFRQLGYALGVAVLGTVLTSRMQDTLGPAAHAVAGGGAGSLHDMASDHMAYSHTAPDHMVSQHMVSEHMCEPHSRPA